MRLAVFVTAHGYGHATRVRAVLDELARMEPTLDLLLVGAVPRRFFADLPVPLAFHDEDVDCPPRQHDPFVIDREATLASLARQLPFDGQRIDALARRLVDSGRQAVLCDISPLGLLAARRAGLPGVLMENFTWDFIYRSMDDARLVVHADHLAEAFATASLRIRVAPGCGDGPCDLLAPPVSRRPRLDRAAVRRILCIDEEQPLVVVSLGGTGHHFPWVDRLHRQWPGVHFVIAAGDGGRRDRNVEFRASSDSLDHPSLVVAADAVVGKAGYSTVAEVHAAGVPFACFDRPGFAESPPLMAFVAEHLPSLSLPAAGFDQGVFIDVLDRLLSMPRAPREDAVNGAGVVARSLLRHAASNGAGQHA